jgi:hypothetical protein
VRWVGSENPAALNVGLWILTSCGQTKISFEDAVCPQDLDKPPRMNSFEDACPQIPQARMVYICSFSYFSTDGFNPTRTNPSNFVSLY